MQCILADINFNPSHELQYARNFEVTHPWGLIFSDPMRMTMAMFLSEFLNKLLREAQPDARLWDYLLRCLSLLNSPRGGSPNFHIVFTATLSAFVGITPDVAQYGRNAIFDLRAGSYTYLPPSHSDVVRPPLSRWPLILSKLNYSNCKALHLSGADRYTLLSAILRYYSLHFPGMQNFKSLDVMRDVFAR